MREFGRDLIRGGHYGQRSCEPHYKAGHMAAPTNAAKREESPCQPGAVHTWHETDMPTALRHVRYQGQSGNHVLAVSISPFETQSRRWMFGCIFGLDGRERLSRTAAGAVILPSPTKPRN